MQRTGPLDTETGQGAGMTPHGDRHSARGGHAGPAAAGRHGTAAGLCGRLICWTMLVGQARAQTSVATQATPSAAPGLLSPAEMIRLQLNDGLSAGVAWVASPATLGVLIGVSILALALGAVTYAFMRDRALVALLATLAAITGLTAIQVRDAGVRMAGDAASQAQRQRIAEDNALSAAQIGTHSYRVTSGDQRWEVTASGRDAVCAWGMLGGRYDGEIRSGELTLKGPYAPEGRLLAPAERTWTDSMCSREGVGRYAFIAFARAQITPLDR